MPNLNVTSNAVKLAQTTTNTPTLISNIGSENVFLGADPSVNGNVFDHFLSPGKQINWPADKELWAVTDTGTTSIITVMYNATGASATEVGIIGPIDVDIINPVNVQGGGESLYEDNGASVPPSSDIAINVPAPASGLRYYGMQILFQQLGGGSTGDPLYVEVYNNDIAGVNPPVTFVVDNPGSPANMLGAFGTRTSAWFIVPFAGSYPLVIRVYNPSLNTATFMINVRGISQSLPYPIDAGVWERAVNADRNVSMANAAVDEFTVFAPSFVDRVFNIDTLNNVSGGNLTLEAVTPLTGLPTTWYRLDEFPNHAYFGGSVIASNQLEPFTKSRFVVPGNGRLHRLRVTNTVVGTVRISYRGRGMA